MSNRFQRFFQEQVLARVKAGPGADSDRALKLATAALLVEMTRADFRTTADEDKAARDALQDFFQLDRNEAESVVALAGEEADRAVSLYPFTELVDKNFSAGQKERIIEMLWRVAFADGHKSHHEEHLVRKVAALLHVPHHRFIHARQVVENGAQ
ncbi:MAG TPA: TerB family tellurite resistance protein [Gammaproteobacteria bacterium]|nr:TerB family tellurite resistance protein [Gammaproteobacteria bacterium]